MGNSMWSDDADKHLRKSYTSKSVNDIFVNNKTNSASADMLPKGVKFRESRDSKEHPETLAVFVALDQTGSMGRIPEIMVREKLGTLMNTLINHGIKDAQVLFGAIGDHKSDDCPLQVGQFESGTEELHKWLTNAYLEGNGGGQNKESYLLAWLFAGRHTSIDCLEKRNQKGVLFTIGDEASWDKVSASSLKDIMGYSEAEEITDKDILAEAQRSYHVFHIHVNEGGYKDNPTIIGYWKDMLHERLIILNDYNQISEIIASTVAMIHGVDLDNVVSGFDSKTAKSVKDALIHVNTSLKNNTDGVVRL